jgi:hypothetical protein
MRDIRTIFIFIVWHVKAMPVLDVSASYCELYRKLPALLRERRAKGKQIVFFAFKSFFLNHPQQVIKWLL